MTTEVFGTVDVTRTRRVFIPVVLRVLRSTPLAEAGEDFPDEDLHKLFEADGGWYRPNARRRG